jgi:hypothetical protein
MSIPSQSAPDDELGPIDFLAIEFPGAHISAPGFEQLLSLADQGVIDILDLEFVGKDPAGNASKLDVGELTNPDGVDLSAWAGRIVRIARPHRCRRDRRQDPARQRRRRDRL